MKLVMIEVSRAAEKNDIDIVRSIRQDVFVDEQNCPPELEWEYEDESVHFLARLNGIPAGTARWRKTTQGYKLERFAVLNSFRGQGVAQALVQVVLDDLPAEAAYVYLHSQIQACSLYEKFGFVTVGDQFEEAGIRHLKMVLKTDERFS